MKRTLEWENYKSAEIGMTAILHGSCSPSIHACMHTKLNRSITLKRI